jgi:hypothetical protein
MRIRFLSNESFIFAVMFRKIILSMIAVFYLAATSGMVINVHYCMGKVSSITFNDEADHNDGTCDKCGMVKTENHCCKDEITKGKVNDSHQTSTVAFELASASSAVPVRTTVLSDPEQGQSAIPLLTYFSPPPRVLNRVYLDVNVFRI